MTVCITDTVWIVSQAPSIPSTELKTRQELNGNSNEIRSADHYFNPGFIFVPQALLSMGNT